MSQHHWRETPLIRKPMVVPPAGARHRPHWCKFTPKHKFHRRAGLHEGGRETRAHPHTSRFQQELTERDATIRVPPAPHTTRAACCCPPVGLAPPLGYEPSRPPHQIGYRAFGFWELLAGRGCVPCRKMVHRSLAA